ncbi:AbgT family transporter [Aurantiacibacter gangjinensis]|uniref:Membrane protein n=1 Tax=Aurantiacibacter gangjinensis TaxID=502682 RepID=A0A0G9MRN9_9SPHN|nr:AbgT family transporter [Aurantiacibacter gangjinensis]APE26916.1 sodium:sulfate symporter transmembrane domain protein [Aurantiacibacter gangjinensis]KLE33375.1 membrane protein [Aurantiacibacter gangjinensis]
MSDANASAGTAAPQKGFLGWVERTGNRLPDPVFIFFYLIIALVAISVISELAGLSAQHPTTIDETTGEASVIQAASLLSPENIQRLWVQMPTTFTHFHPLGYVLVVMLGAGVAERSGFFAAGMSAAVRKAPTILLTPVVALVAMLGNHAADAGYVVLIPLAGILFAAAGRHPLAGIAAAFAGVSGGFSANISPGQLDALLFGITEEAVQASSLDPAFTTNIAGNWYFIAVMTFIYLPIIWYVTDRVIEPRLGAWKGGAAATGGDVELAEGSSPDPEEHTGPKAAKGLRWAGLAALGVVALWALMVFAPGTPLIDEQACLTETGARVVDCSIHTELDPFYRSLVAAFFILFLATGWAYGKAAGTINNHRDLVNMMAESMKDMGYYLVLAFAAAHFVEMFEWSNLGLISAVHGADAIRSTGLPLPLVIGLMVLFAALLNLFIGSASAKWALLAPILVPMLMLLGISPEGATAAYRVGDSATNIITPLMVYFPLILVFAQRWKKDFGLGSLTAMMIPYSIWLLVSGVILIVAWFYLGIPLGPDAPVEYVLPDAGTAIAPAMQ